jgi:hypothetical protein
MKISYKETARCNSACYIQVGISSWSDDDVSVKFAAKDKNGKVTRQGEVPIAALPQMLEMAIREGYLKLK